MNRMKPSATIVALTALALLGLGGCAVQPAPQSPAHPPTVLLGGTADAAVGWARVEELAGHWQVTGELARRSSMAIPHRGLIEVEVVAPDGTVRERATAPYRHHGNNHHALARQFPFTVPLSRPPAADAEVRVGYLPYGRPAVKEEFVPAAGAEER